MTVIPKAPVLDKKLAKELKNREKDWKNLLESIDAVLWPNNEGDVFTGYIPTTIEDDQDTEISFTFCKGNKASTSYLSESAEGTWNKVFKQILKFKKSVIPPVPKTKK